MRSKAVTCRTGMAGLAVQRADDGSSHVTCVILFSALNVGGHNVTSMADLTALADQSWRRL